MVLHLGLIYIFSVSYLRILFIGTMDFSFGLSFPLSNVLDMCTYMWVLLDMQLLESATQIDCFGSKARRPRMHLFLSR